MKTFSERLQRAQEASGMTGSDLARWFDRPRATVSTWLNGRTPFGPAAPIALKGLALLEASLKTRSEYYPLPAHMSWAERQKYVRGMRDDAERHHRVSEVRATG
jgi:hypothetical protein